MEQETKIVGGSERQNSTNFLKEFFIRMAVLSGGAATGATIIGSIAHQGLAFDSNTFIPSVMGLTVMNVLYSELIRK